jgi:hypothetical protein
MMPRERRAVEAYTRTGMSEKAPKRKAKPKRGQESVLGTLPASRPERLGRPRANGAPQAAKRAPAKANGHTGTPRPKAVRPAAPPLQPAHPGEPPPKSIGVPTGTELVTTSIRAAGELAQIGLTVGGQVLKRTIDRIPRP